MKKGILSFVFLLALGTVFTLAFDSNSQDNTEWTMFGKYLNHTSWDGIDFPIISGLNNASYTTEGHIYYSSPAVANGYVYVGSWDDNLYQLNASNVSQLIASYTTGGGVISSPAIANGYVYVGSHDDNLYQLNASNVSQLIANYTTGGDVRSSPAIANGYVYVGSKDYNLYQLNASNISQLIANYTTEEEVWSSPAIANGYVYVGSNDNKVYQLNANNVSQLIATESTSPELNVSNVTLSVGSSFGVLFNASDSSGLSYWWINDTTNFKINQSGYFENNVALSIGNYSVTISVNDTLGNTASEIIIVTVNAAESAEEEDNPSSSSGTPTYYLTESNMQEGYTKQLYTNWKLNFKSDGENHQLKLNSFNKINKTAKITISSDPQTKTLSIGEGWKVNLGNDSYYDLLVRLDNITSNKANIFIQEIEEEMETLAVTGNETLDVNDDETQDNGERSSWGIWVIVLLIVAFLIGWKYLGRKKKIILMLFRHQ